MTVETPSPASEGVRTIQVRNASADYEIARSGDEWLLRYGMRFDTGDCHGRGIPWETYPTREACIETFLKYARRHFSRAIPEFDNEGQSYASQIKAGKEMMARLDGDGLFGFIEPDPVV